MSGGTAPLFHKLCTSWRVKDSFTPQQFYHWGKSERCAFGRRLDGPQRQSAYFGKQNLADHEMCNKQTTEVSRAQMPSSLVTTCSQSRGLGTHFLAAGRLHFLSPLAHLVHLQTFVLIN